MWSTTSWRSLNYTISAPSLTRSATCWVIFTRPKNARSSEPSNRTLEFCSWKWFAGYLGSLSTCSDVPHLRKWSSECSTSILFNRATREQTHTVGSLWKCSWQTAVSRFSYKAFVACLYSRRIFNSLLSTSSCIVRTELRVVDIIYLSNILSQPTLFFPKPVAGY